MNKMIPAWNLLVVLCALLAVSGCGRPQAVPSPVTDDSSATPAGSEESDSQAAVAAVVGAEETAEPKTPTAADMIAEPTAAAPEVEEIPGNVGSTPRTYSNTEVHDLAMRVTGDDWPSFLGPTRDSKSAEKGIVTKWPAAGLPIVWRRSLGTSYGIGAVSRGRYFQFDRYGDNARLTCLNAETGDELWRWECPTDYRDAYGYNYGPRTSPVVDDDRVYIFGAEGMLHCLRVTDGQLFWRCDTSKEFGVVQNFFGVGSTPVVEGELLIAMIGGSPASSQALGAGNLDRVEPNGTGVVAFNKYTGEVAYKTGDELASYAAPQLATIAGRSWGLVFARGGLLGFEPATGKIDFHYPWRAEILESVNASTPVVVGDEVLISETYGPGSSLLKISPGKADVIWRDGDRRDKAMQTHWNTAVHHEGFLYGSSGRHEGNAELRCIAWRTGKVMWSEPGLTRSSLLYVDGHFVCLSEDGSLRLLKANPRAYEVLATTVLEDQSSPPNPFTGRRRQLLQAPCWAAPILSHGLLYVRGDDQLVCLELIP